MRFLLISISITAFFGHDLQAQSINIAKSNGEVTHLIRLNGEDQHGHEAGFVSVGEKPLLIFFLPKTDSRTKAEALIDDITAWFERMDGRGVSSVSKLLVVEPYRTGPLVNRFFRSKVKGKPFQVIRDPEGTIVQMVHEDRYSVLLWLTDRKGKIVYKSFDPFSEEEL